MLTEKYRTSPPFPHSSPHPSTVPPFVMAVRNPLDLPEIRGAIAPFLTTEDMARCVRVCKSWHSSFLPYFWSTIDIPKHGKQPDLEALQRHKDYTHHLIYQGKVPDGHRSLQLPVLRTLHIAKAANQDTEMVGNQLSLIHLKLISTSYNKINWCPPASLSNLTSLSLTRLTVHPQDKDTLWNVFSKLETLELCYSSMPTLPESRTGSWRIKDLLLESVRGVNTREQLRWIERCTQLKRLTWIPFDVFMSNVTEQLAQSAAANSWPELEELNYPFFGVSDRQASLIINGMGPVLSLTINFTQPFDLVKTALRPHFPWLKTLDFMRTCSGDADFILEILKSCPQLESLQMGAVPVRDMLDDDTPWACESSLRYLGVGFKVDNDIKEAGQRKLLGQLSRLHNLEVLNLSSPTALEQSLDLRLESGLEQLATLTRLQELAFTNTDQKMTTKDIEWMIEHWKNLKRIYGTWNVNDNEEYVRMDAKFREAGISTTYRS